MRAPRRAIARAAATTSGAAAVGGAIGGVQPAYSRVISWVSARPAATDGSPRSVARNSALVVTPRTASSRRAPRRRAMAPVRSGACATTLAIRASYSGGTTLPDDTPASQRMPGPAGSTNASMRPGEGANARAGSSAQMRASTAWPRTSRSSWRNGSGSPAAIAICSWTRSTPQTISVTGCSTWRRVFISRK